MCPRRSRGNRKNSKIISEYKEYRLEKHHLGQTENKTNYASEASN